MAGHAHTTTNKFENAAVAAAAVGRSAPRIYPLGLHLAHVEKAAEAFEIAATAPGADPETVGRCRRAERLLGKRAEAVRSLIHTLPAATAGDAVIQLASIVGLAEDIEINERPAGQVTELAGDVGRIALGLFPVVADGVRIDALNLGHLESLRADRLLGVGSGPKPVRRTSVSARSADGIADADILRICSEFQAMSNQLASLEVRADDNDEATFVALDARWLEEAKRIAGIKPSTTGGLRAKAAAALVALERKVAIEPGTPVDEQAQAEELLAIEALRGAAEGCFGQLAQNTPVTADETVSGAGAQDAELITLCDEFSSVQTKISAHWRHGVGESSWRGPAFIEDDDERDAADAPLEARLRELAEQICALKPATLDGCRAVLRSVLLWDHELRELVEERRDNVDLPHGRRLLVTLARGLTGDRPVARSERR